MVHPEFSDPTPEQLLWDIAFACADRRAQLETKLDASFAALSTAEAAGLNLHQRELHAGRQEEYWDKHRESLQLADYQERLLSTLEKVEAGDATQAEIDAFLPLDPADESQSPSKRKRALWAAAARTGLDPRNDYDRIGWDLIHGSDPGRLTTGRNRTRIVTNGKLDSYDAETMFFDQTADTHGGKVRSAGKDGRYYTLPSGRRVRKR